MTDDTISRQVTIDAIEQHKTAVLDEYEYDEGIAYGYAAAHRHLVEIVKRLPSAQPERKWVPLDSGRFPDDSGTYIVTAYDGAKERVTFAKYQKRLKRWELTGARAYWRVLAWMSIPTPYEERREE